MYIHTYVCIYVDVHILHLKSSNYYVNFNVRSAASLGNLMSDKDVLCFLKLSVSYDSDSYYGEIPIYVCKMYN